MKRKTFLAIALASAAVVATVPVVPVLAHGSQFGSGWQKGQQQIGGGMMGGGMGYGGQGYGAQGGMMGGPQGFPGGQGGMMGGQQGFPGGQGGMMGMMMDQGMGQGMGFGMGGIPGGGMMGSLFEQFDIDGNGIVSADEAKAGLTGQLEKYDANGDGTLSLVEFQVLHTDLLRERMVDRFQALDNDGDGKVTVDEITAPAKLIERMQALHDAREGAATNQPAPNMMNDN